MKEFDNFKDAMLYAKHIMDEANKTYLGAVTEQVYKDSKELTYYSDQNNTTHMYDTGEKNSNFKNGIIIEKAPYVRRRYYEGGIARGKHKQAQPRWFEKTVSKYKDEYVSMYNKEFDKAKKG